MTSNDVGFFDIDKYPRSGAYKSTDGVLILVDVSGFSMSLLNMNIPYEIIDGDVKSPEKINVVREKFVLDLTKVLLENKK